MSEEERAESRDISNIAARPWRWKLGIAIFVIGTLAELAVWFGAPDRTYQVFLSMPVLSGMCFALFLWWTFFSRLPWRRRLMGLGGVTVLNVVVLMCVRVDGFEGDMFPRFRFSWQQTAEDRAKDYWEQARIKQSANRTPEETNSDKSESSKDANANVKLQTEGLPITDKDWPEFRRDRTGIVPGTTLQRDWDNNPPRELWRHPIGSGWSSFAVVDRFAITQEQRKEDEAVVCYDLKTGDQIWEHTDRVKFTHSLGGPGPRATPTVFDSRVYSLGATGILNCLDVRTGHLIWTKNILMFAETGNLPWAMAGSPLVYDDVVVVNPGGSSGRALVAFDRLNGNLIWSSGGHPAAYVSPMLVTLSGRQQVLIYDGDGLGGYDPKEGDELWRFPWTNGQKINSAQPIVVDANSVLVGTGYGKGSTLVDVKNSKSKWDESSSRNFKQKFNSGVLHNGYIYGFSENFLTCLDVTTGSREWKKRGYGYGQLILVNNMLLVLAEDGSVVLVEASPDGPKEHGRIDEAIVGKTWNHPVLVRNRLLIRNGEEVACYVVD